MQTSQLSVLRKSRLGRDRPVLRGPQGRRGRNGRRLRGARSRDASDRRPEDPAALRPELALPVQARVPRARGRAPPQPGAPSRARSAGGGPALLHDGARRRDGLPRLRARGRRRSTEHGPIFAVALTSSVERDQRHPPGPVRAGATCRWLLPRLWATSRRAPTRTGSVRRCANSCKAWARCTPPASCTGTSSHRTSS